MSIRPSLRDATYKGVTHALVAVSICASTTASNAGNSTQNEVVLAFPNERGYGNISKVTRVNELETNAKRIPLGEAKGTIKLPPGTIVFYEPGPKFFQYPQMIKKLAPNSIQYIKLQFTAMDDGEEKMSDSAIGYLPHLKGLQAATFDKSDTTDEGISRLAGMPNLRAVSATESMVNGACLKSLASCPKLLMVRFGAIQINNDSLSYLKDFKSLRRLVLSRSGLNSRGIQNISMCQSVRELDISNNPKISDADVPKIRSLKKLEYVNLRCTAVTISGVKALTAGSNVRVIMPKMFSQYTKVEQDEIKRMKSNVRFDLDHIQFDPDYKTIFGTINRK